MPDSAPAALANVLAIERSGIVAVGTSRDRRDEETERFEVSALKK